MEEYSAYILEATQNNLIKFGEIFLITSKWEVNFKCDNCDTVLKSFRKFLRHSIEHSYIPDDAEIENLIETSVTKDHEDDINKETYNKDTEENEFESEEDSETSQEDLVVEFSFNQSATRESAVLPNQIIHVVEPKRRAVPRKILPKGYSDIVSQNSMFNIEVVHDQGIKASETLTKESGKSDELPHPSDTQISSKKPYKKGQSSLQCPDCDKMFPNGDLLDKHVAIYRPFFCEICNARFRDRGNFKVHQKRHLGIKKFICEQCGKRFTTSTDLQFHLKRIHTDTKPFKCGTCGKAHKLKMHLQAHIRRVHSDRPRKFACTKCDKSFYEKYTLKEHQVTHDQVRPFACNVCYKKFSRNWTLTQHMKLHSNDFTYPEK